MAILIAIAVGVFLFAMGVAAAAEYIARGRPVLPAADTENRPTVTVGGID